MLYSYNYFNDTEYNRTAVETECLFQVAVVNSKMQYCCTFYGLRFWINNGASLRHVCVAWRKALRGVWILSQDAL